MAGKNQDFSQSDLARLLSKPETRALLARLQSLDADALRRAAQQAMQGNTAQAAELISPLMHDEQVRELTRKMRDTDGGI